MTVHIVRSSRRPRWPLWAVGVVAGWLALCAGAVWLSEAAGREVCLCAFRRLTGVPCPTCGMTRGLRAMARGRIGEGWTRNPLWFTVLGAAAALAVVRVTTGRTLRLRLTRRERRAAVAALLLLVLANWAYVICFVG